MKHLLSFRHTSALALTLFTATCSLTLAAQNSEDSIGSQLLHGRILDTSGAGIANAKLLARCGPYLRDAKSTSGGEYSIDLSGSTCELIAEASGFARNSSVVRLPVPTKSGSYDLTLQLASGNSTVTVTATIEKETPENVARIDAPLMDLPLSVQVVPVTLAQDQGFTRLLDVVRNVSGVTSKEAYFGVTDTFNIRGFDASAGLFNGFHRDFYLSILDLSSVDSVQIIKGPSSVTSGFLEPGGVVDIESKRPLPSPIFDFLLTGDTFGSKRGQWDIGLPITQTLRFRATGAAAHTGSFRDYIYGDRATSGLAVDWNPTANTSFQTSAYWLFSSSEPDRGIPIFGPFSLTIPIERYFGETADVYRQRSAQISEMVHHRLGQQWSVRIGFDAFQNKDYRNNVQAIGLEEDNRTVDRDYTIVPGSEGFLTGLAEVSGNFNTFGLHHHVVAGLDWLRQTQFYDFGENDNFTPLDLYNPVYGAPRIPAPSGSFFHGYSYDSGFYGQDLISLGKHWKALVGVRQDQFRYHDKDEVALTRTDFHQGAFSPRVGLTYQPTEAWSIYANYATSFNPQQFSLLANGTLPKPSRGKQQEAGVKWTSANRRWNASGDYFRITKTNVATTDPENINFSILTGKDESKGVEFDTVFRPRTGLLLRANFADISAKVSSDTVIPIGSELLNVPRLQGTLWTQADVPHLPLSVAFGWFAVGQRQATLPNTFLIPKYNRFDAGLFWHVRSNIELSANVQNFTDVKYYTSQDYSLYPGSPVNAVLSLRFNIPNHDSGMHP